MGLILKCCIILHNLILDDERGLVLEDVLLNDESPASSIFQHDPERQPLAAHQQFADSHDLAEHIRLRYAVARELYKPGTRKRQLLGYPIFHWQRTSVLQVYCIFTPAAVDVPEKISQMVMEVVRLESSLKQVC